jgi:hypothetical protein
MGLATPVGPGVQVVAGGQQAIRTNRHRYVRGSGSVRQCTLVSPQPGQRQAWTRCSPVTVPAL